MKTTIFRSSGLMILLAGALMAPAQLSSQAVRTHQVRRGETLWEIAADSLGDGNRWREILQLNPELRSARSLAAGSTIRLPAASRRPSASAPSRPPAARRADARGRTMFYGKRPTGYVQSDSVITTQLEPAVPASVFESVSAPYVTDAAALDQGGRCLSVGPAARSETGGVLLNSTLTIEPPAGAAADSGSRWILVRRGPVLAELGPVAIPTVVVRLTSAAAGGVATAEVVAQFDAMSCSDLVLPMGDPTAVPSGRLTTVTDGARGQVAWVASQSHLPTLQHALILDMGAANGVRAGDRVTIYERSGSAVVASADIIRVSQRTSTAIIVRQVLGAPAVGLPVRVTEKLP